MSQLLYPVGLPGETFPITRESLHSTEIQLARSGFEVRIGLYNYPRYKWTIPYSFLDAAQAALTFQQLLGLYNRLHGSFDTCLYKADNDNACIGSLFGTGDGTTTQFQLGRTLGGFTEPIFNVNPANVIHPDLSTTASPTIYGGSGSVSASGLVTFGSPPPNGQALTVDMNYYWRVRFETDSLSFDNFMQDLWELKKVVLYSVKGS